MSPPEGFDPKLAHIAAQWAHDRPLVACRFDPSGRYAFCGSEDAVVERFQLADGAKTLFTGGHDTWVRSLAFTADGQRVISAACDGKLTWWEVAAEAPKPLLSVDAHKGWIRSAETSPDGSLLATGGNDHFVRLWDTASGKLIRELAGHARHVYSVAFDPTGKLLLSGDLVGNVIEWEVTTGKEIRRLDAKTLHSYNDGQRVDFGGVRALAFSPDGKWLAAAGLHKATNPLGAVHEPLVLLFNRESQQIEKQQIAEGITHGVLWRLRWLADGSLMGVCGGASGGFLIFWKAGAEKDFHRFQLPNIARDMDLHPDGLQVATAHHDHHLRLTRLSAKPA